MKFCYHTCTRFTLPKQSQRSRSILQDGSRFKQSQRSRSILQDGSRFLGLFWKEKILSYNQRNMVYVVKNFQVNKKYP